MSFERSPDPPAGVVAVASPYPFEETVTRLLAAIEAGGLTLFATIDHSAEAARVGLTMQPARVLVFGRPAGGTPVMVAVPRVALDLPLRLLVWQTSDGSVEVDHTDPVDLVERFGIPARLIANVSGVAALVAGALAD